MKKFIICFCALIFSAGAFAQETTDVNPELVKGEDPKEIVTTTTEEVFEEITPEKEAEELTKMMSKTTEITDDQIEEIYKIVLKALKNKVKLEPLRKENSKEFEQKEMEIYKNMNDEINSFIMKG